MKKRQKSIVATIGLAGVILSGVALPAQAANYTKNDIKTTDRVAVSNGYKDKFAKSEKISIGWTGKISGCKAGTSSKASINASLNAINYYRGLNGLEKVYTTSTYNNEAQAAALIMGANKKLSHSPTKSWKCYSAVGAKAAGMSNIYMTTGKITNSTSPVTGYMDDHGSGNEVVGHRRWLMKPSTKSIGIGSVENANAIKVFGTTNHSKYANPTYVNFPNANYSPAQLEPNGLWSVSRSNADFRSAKVKVYDYTSKKWLSVKKHRVVSGYGDNTMSFTVSNVGKDVSTLVGKSSTRKYKVEITGVKIGTKSYNHSYTTTFFDGNRSK